MQRSDTIELRPFTPEMAAEVLAYLQQGKTVVLESNLRNLNGIQGEHYNGTHYICFMRHNGLVGIMLEWVVADVTKQLKKVDYQEVNQDRFLIGQQTYKFRRSLGVYLGIESVHDTTRDALRVFRPLSQFQRF